ncbi:helix-turn-helix domain-containing protein [Candidatus Parcubacteria bacterium]|nr:MAG: helix-turn-helix domain-containing protein [Candidatus Parcubacteria bacterium]
MIAERIKAARKFRGYSQRELARRAEVSYQAISFYEKGINIPGESVLNKLAEATGFSVAWFETELLIKEDDLKLAFRKKASLTKGKYQQIIYKVIDWLERYIMVESLFPDRKINDILPYGKWHIEKIADVESIAIELRKEWNLGLGPISSLVDVLEDKGIKICLIDMDKAFDACTFKYKDSAAIVLNKNISYSRELFNILHELCHLLFCINHTLDKEKVAHRFAGSFLVPEAIVKSEVGRFCKDISLTELYYLKKKYGLSMAAWIYRLKDLEIIDTTIYRRLCIKMSKKGYRQEEPGDKEIAIEQPKRLERLVYKALGENLMTISTAADLLGIEEKIIKKYIM